MNSIKTDKGLTEIELVVELFMEGEYHVAYTPALDLAGQGYTDDEAIEDLKGTIRVTIEWCQENGTLDAMLLKYGWTVTKVPKPIYIPPKLAKERIIRSGYQTKKIAVFAE